MIKIESHTNKSFLVFKNKKKFFYQQKIHNGFNHLINYSYLSDFNFVPKLIKDSNKEIYWEFIEGITKNKLSKKELTSLVTILKTIHKTKIIAPKFNLDKRIANYEKLCKNKKRKILEIKKWKKTIKKILEGFDKNTFIHGDIWEKNIILREEKIFLVDWEYSSLGDIHFELAYIILSFRFTKEEELFFLDLYNDYDIKKLEKAKAIVCYYTIIWINAQDTIFFDDQEFKDKLANFDYLLDK